jgi:hypothetical protein
VPRTTRPTGLPQGSCSVFYRDDLRAAPRSAVVCRGRTRTISSRYPGVTARSSGSASASRKRMRAAQAEDSAMTVILPLSRAHRFTLLARSGPNAFITATCHTDSSGAERARWARAGRRAEIKSPAVLGLEPGRTVCLFRGGLLGIVSRLLGLMVLRCSRLPARYKSLNNKEQDRKGPHCPQGLELAR